MNRDDAPAQNVSARKGQTTEMAIAFLRASGFSKNTSIAVINPTQKTSLQAREPYILVPLRAVSPPRLVC